MKEKSSAPWAGEASCRGSASAPSVESSSELEWSTLALCWSPAEVGSVWEDRDDRRLPGGCFRTDVVLLEGDGDSGARLQEGEGRDTRWHESPDRLRMQVHTGGFEHFG